MAGDLVLPRRTGGECEGRGRPDGGVVGRIAFHEIDTQRDQLGQLLGKIRDLETSYAEEAAQRIAVLNTALKGQVRSLTDEKRSLEERLQASRSNNRFLDKRIADLEAEVVSLKGLA